LDYYVILTDREIRIALKDGAIAIAPTPDLSIAITSTAIDLTLSDVFKEWRPLNGVQICPGKAGYKYSDLAKQFQVDGKEPYVLRPQSFVLAWTAEKVTIPIKSKLAARVEGKSSLARLGVSIHVTAPIIHAGFTGQIQLEMFNFGPHEIVLNKGMWICQLVFEQTSGTPERGYEGLFSGQADH
jgi:dCTP deaminase